MRLLIVEDEPRIVEIVTSALRKAGFAVDAVATAANKARETSPGATHKADLPSRSQAQKAKQPPISASAAAA